jgi:hypothetical protein
MLSKQWDPLSSSDSADPEIINAAKKREIKNILKSYVGLYDCFSELIQNSMDAIDKRSKLHTKDEYEGKIWLTIDLKKNSFHITDNGIGFNESEFKAFLAPNISFKDGSSTRGSKGVGATYIAYGFNYLQLGTKGPDYEFIGELKEGRSWVEDTTASVTRPYVKESQPLHEPFRDIDRGSTFTIIFGGSKTRPKDLKWFAASTPEQWLYLLLTKTPLGSILFSDNPSQRIKFNLSVLDKDGTEKMVENEDAKYIYPHDKIKSSMDLKEILGYQEKLLRAGRDTSKLPVKFYKLNGIYEFLGSQEILSLPTKRLDESKELIEEFKVEAYGYFAYSTVVWDELNDKLANLRKGFRVLKGGLQLSNNHMVQGDLLAIPLTENIGYQNQCHVIVHFTNADPDLGRKGFQPELKELAEDIAVGIVNKFKRWKKLLKTDTGAKPSIHKEIDLHEWVKEQEKHEEVKPLKLINKNFFHPLNEISITSVPQSEQDVIVLFNQLLAGGVIRGMRLLATSQNKQYDGVFRYVAKKPFENHIFDKQENPLGIHNSPYLPIISPPKILEYKFNVDALIREFESEEKNERDIDLVVAWELGEEWRKNYEITSLLDLDNIQHRDFHGLTHTINTANSKFQAIILGELVEYLNDVDGVQSKQKEKYGDDIV